MEDNIKSNNKSILKKYSIVFAIVLFIVTIPFFVKSLNPGISGLYADSFSQHLLFMRDFVIDIKQWLFNGEKLSSYSFDIGYGADMVQSYGYYSIFDPFNIIAILLPIKWIEFSFYLILTLKLYLGGLFFCLYLKRFDIKNSNCIITGGIFYIFGVCTLFSSLRHPIFASTFMLLPLVFLGIEKAINKESKILLILTTFLMICVQFYLSAYALFGMEMYLMFRLWKGKNNIKHWISELLKYNLYIILAIVMASFVLLTQAYALSFNGRTNGNKMVIYSFKYYAGLIATFMIPISNMLYTNGLGNALAVFLILLFILYFNDYIWLKKLIIVEASFLLIPIFGYAFSLFAYVNNRWSFILLIPLILAMTISMDNFNVYKKENCVKVAKTLLYVCLLGVILGALCLVYEVFSLSIALKIMLTILIIGLLVIGWNSISESKLSEINFKIKDFYKFFMYVQVFLTVAFTTGFSFIVHNSYKFDDHYSNEFSSSNIEDNGFYRVSKNSYVSNLDYFTNDSIYGEYSSTVSFNSMNNGHIVEMIDYFEVINGNSSVGYNGLNNRYVLETLFGVKYFVSKDSSYNSVPYNFEYVSSFESIKYNEKDYDLNYSEFEKENEEYVKETTSIYMNKNSLSLGYLYSGCVAKKSIDSLNGLEKQNIILDTLILDNGCSNQTISMDNLEEKQYELISYDNIQLSDNYIKVNKKNASIKIKVKNIVDEELYIKIDEINFVGEKENRVTYTSSKMENVVITRELGINFYKNNNNRFINMGYYDNKDEEIITITFENKGEYSFDNLKVYTLNMDNVISKIERLQQNQLEDIVIDGDNIYGKINADQDGYLFLSIPYNEGFSIYVNGEKKNIYKANVGFMAVEISEGENVVTIQYKTKYLKEGFIISGVGFIVFLIYIPIEIYQRKKNINKVVKKD